MLGIEWLARPGNFTASLVVHILLPMHFVDHCVFYIEGRIQQNVHETVHSLATELHVPDKILYVMLSSSASVATTVNTERPCGEFYIGN